jgi:hypothetical protein
MQPEAGKSQDGLTLSDLAKGVAGQLRNRVKGCFTPQKCL